MSTPLIAIVTLLYLGVAVDKAWHGYHAGAVIFIGYALANLGFIFGGQD